MATKRKKVVNSHNITIPQDLYFSEIIPRLPAKSLIRFKSTSKQWNSLISSLDFAYFRAKLCKHNNLLIQAGKGLYHDPFTLFNLQLTHDNFEPTAFIKYNYRLKEVHRIVYLIGSCHGLICYYDLNRLRFLVSNPTIQKLCSIQVEPKLVISHTPRRILLAGFGYDSSTEDYKFVFLTRSCNSSGYVCLGHLFALKNSNMWKELDMSWYKTKHDSTKSLDYLNYQDRCIVCPIQIKDTLYWLLHCTNIMTFAMLLVFDLAGEVFSVVELPSSDDNIIGITRIRGCLCKVSYQSGSGKKLGRKPPRLEVQMLEKHGVWDSWQTFYVCDVGMRVHRDYLNIFEFRDDDNDDKIFILKNFRAYKENSLRIHLIDSQSILRPSQVAIEGFGGHELRCAYSFIESFIWPSYFSDKECHYSLSFS